MTKLEEILLSFGGDCHDYYFGHSDNHHEARHAIKELVKSLMPSPDYEGYDYWSAGFEYCRKAMLKKIEESL